MTEDTTTAIIDALARETRERFDLMVSCVTHHAITTPECRMSLPEALSRKIYPMHNPADMLELSVSELGMLAVAMEGYSMEFNPDEFDQVGEFKRVSPEGEKTDLFKYSVRHYADSSGRVAMLEITDGYGKGSKLMASRVAKLV